MRISKHRRVYSADKRYKQTLAELFHAELCCKAECHKRYQRIKRRIYQHYQLILNNRIGTKHSRNIRYSTQESAYAVYSRHYLCPISAEKACRRRSTCKFLLKRYHLQKHTECRVYNKKGNKNQKRHSFFAFFTVKSIQSAQMSLPPFSVYFALPPLRIKSDAEHIVDHLENKQHYKHRTE